MWIIYTGSLLLDIEADTGGKGTLPCCDAVRVTDSRPLTCVPPGQSVAHPWRKMTVPLGRGTPDRRRFIKNIFLSKWGAVGS